MLRACFASRKLIVNKGLIRDKSVQDCIGMLLIRSYFGRKRKKNAMKVSRKRKKQVSRSVRCLAENPFELAQRKLQSGFQLEIARNRILSSTKVSTRPPASMLTQLLHWCKAPGISLLTSTSTHTQRAAQFLSYKLVPVF